MWPIDTVAVLGAGEAARALALAAAWSGCAVRLLAEGSAGAGAAEALRARVEAAFTSGALPWAERQRVHDAILVTSDLEEAAVGADLAVDGRGRPDLVALAPLVRASALLGLAPGAEAAALEVPQPGRVVVVAIEETGHAIPRVVVAPGPATSPHALRAAARFAARATGGTPPRRR